MIPRCFFARTVNKKKGRKPRILSKTSPEQKRICPFHRHFFILSVKYHRAVITCFECGFHLWVWADAMQIMLFIRISVVILVLLTYLPAEWLTGRIVK